MTTGRVTRVLAVIAWSEQQPVLIDPCRRLSAVTSPSRLLWIPVPSPFPCRRAGAVFFFFYNNYGIKFTLNYKLKLAGIQYIGTKRFCLCVV